jgi:hypothetical protein
MRFKNTGVMENWSVGVLDKKKSVLQSILHSSITPTLLKVSAAL